MAIAVATSDHEYLRKGSLRDLRSRRFPSPWSAERIPCGYVVKDATGQALAYVYARDTKAEADIAKVLAMDEWRLLKDIREPTYER